MLISIVIPAYNEEKYIDKTLQSVNKLEKKKGWQVELLVVNGGSTDKTAEIARNYGARVINEPHRGIGFARQQGLLQAKGEIVAYTDADTIVPKDWLLKHVEALSQPGVVFSYGTFRVYDGRFPYYQHINYIQPHILWWFHHLFGLPIAAGQNLAFWRKKALLVGGFDANIKVMEDVDLAVRMKKIGRLAFLPNLIVYSSGRRSREGLGFYHRMISTLIQYAFGNRKLRGFPDYR